MHNSPNEQVFILQWPQQLGTDIEILVVLSILKKLSFYVFFLDILFDITSIYVNLFIFIFIVSMYWMLNKCLTKSCTGSSRSYGWSMSRIFPLKDDTIHFFKINEYHCSLYDMFCRYHRYRASWGNFQLRGKFKTYPRKF